MTPTKLVDRFGKILTPTLLVLITSIFVFSLFKPMGQFAAPIGDYAEFPLLKGFLDGYMTMDAIAGVLLVLIYGMLAYLGAVSQARFGVTENGAQTLTNVVFYLFGPKGSVLLGIIFSLACLTTSVGLLTSCSQYFAKLMPKVTYKAWVTILSLSSMTFANVGLTQILKISVTVLTAIYPWS